MLVERVTGRLIEQFTGRPVGGIVAVRTDNVTPTVVINSCLGIPMLFTGGGAPDAVRGVLIARIFSFAGGGSCSMYIDNSCLAGSSHILFVSSFLTGNGTTCNVVSLMRRTNTALRNVNFLVRGNFRRNNGRLHHHNVRIRSLTVVSDLSGYAVAVQ